MIRPNAMAIAFAIACLPALLLHDSAGAQTSAQQILEQARAQAREIEELRKVLNSPDQNMRLATFDLMVKSGDEAMKLIAYEAGLASADSVMRAMAFKAVVMSLDKLHLTLAVDPSASKPIRDASEKYLAKDGTGFIVPMNGRKDLDAGTFRMASWEGQISGTDLVFTVGGNSGRLSLSDDNAIAGVVRLGRGSMQFLAKASLR